jgi:hypothetical protein
VRLTAQRFWSKDKHQNGGKMERLASMAALLRSAGLDWTMGGSRVSASPGCRGGDADMAKGGDGWSGGQARSWRGGRYASEGE